MSILDKIKFRSAATKDLEPVDNLASGGFALSHYSNISSMPSITLSSVFAAVEMISNSVAQLPIHIKDSSGNILEDHYLNDVFNKNILSKFTLIKLLVSDMLINGNGIAYIKRENGNPSGLIYCPRGTYTINYNDIDGNLYYLIPKVSKHPIRLYDVIHLLKNSTDGVNGKGLYVYASRAIDTANYTENAAKGYFESGCSIHGILKSTDRLSKKQKDDIFMAWNQAHTGGSNDIAVMPVNLDYIPLSNNASESQLLETRVFNVQEVARYFNISPVLLGDLSHSSYNTIEAAQLEFLIHTLSPYIELIQDEFNRKLCPNNKIVIDLAEDHLLKADKSATANYLKTLTSAGILSINEARHTLGLRPIEGGDKHIIPYTSINDNTIEENKNTIKEENE